MRLQVPCLFPHFNLFRILDYTEKNRYRNAMLVEQTREDALEMHKASKMEGLRKHARKVSAKFGDSGKHISEGDV